jgi:Flp pilus assembly protein TadD
MVGAVLVIGGWAADSRRQSEVWKDSETLWRYALAIDPQSAFAHFQLGAALSAVGRTEEARTEIERAVELLPDQFANNKAGFHAALGLLLQQQKDLRGAERNYRAALRFSEDNVVALNNLGVIYALRGDQRAALDLFVRVLRVIPGYATACLNARALATALGVTPPELGRCPARD